MKKKRKEKKRKEKEKKLKKNYLLKVVRLGNILLYWDKEGKGIYGKRKLRILSHKICVGPFLSSSPSFFSFFFFFFFFFLWKKVRN